MMKCISVVIICLHFFIHTIRCSNILAFMPSPWKSHIISFQPLFLELASRGHNVTVVSKFTIENPPPGFVQLVPSYDFDIDERSDFLMQERKLQYMFYDSQILRFTILLETTELFLSDNLVQDFIKNDQTKFDLVMVESFFQECTIALGHKYSAPVVNLVPLGPSQSVSRWAANPFDFSYIKDVELDGGKTLSFWERVTNTYVGLCGRLIDFIIYYPKMENIMNIYFQYSGHENRPTIIDMLKNVSLHLIDSDVMILSPRPYMPSFVEVPGIHLRPSKKMNKELHRFMDQAELGVVYFNFGTILNVTSIPKQSFQVLISVLGQLKQKVLFKWTNNDTKGFPENFYVDSWFPQKEILNHPNCKLFITHGGIHGLIEAIDAGIPFIGFPIFGDQFQNLKICQENGIGITKNIFRLSENEFKKDVNLVLTDKAFSENSKRISTIFHDRPMSTIDKAVYWVEYVIRHRGAHHLRAAAVDLKWYQYYLLDVFVFFIFVILFFIYICYLICKGIKKFTLNFVSVKQKIN